MNDVLDVFKDKIQSLEYKLGYTFKNKNLLLASITHRSFVAEYSKKIPDYEVLEFLGDAVLSLIVSEILIKEFPRAREGELSQIRSAVISEAYLSKLAKDLNLHDYILISKGERIQKGTERESLLCDVFEAVFGAIYIDSDFSIEKPREIFLKYFKDRLINDIKTESIPKDFKSLLQIETQKIYGSVPQYRLISAEGPEHDKVFTVECKIDSIKTLGKGKSKKEAETQAAKEAYLKIKSE
ncbi:MAG: ribonuclease III [Hydrogenothermaceae bacterium]|nr:ribonuclease III [Hydrogenothermaceae bacterium]